MKLELVGFRSYPNPVTVDFTGKTLAAVLGDTGAGKSSLLDAITYALFRKSSWDGREIRLLVADGAQAMRVTFTFLQNGQRWCVDRTFHAANPNAGRNHLTNLDTGEESDGAGLVDARIRAVLQMGYETFLRVGLLPQGKFDQLLTAADKERTARLRELFGTDTLETVQRLAARHRDNLKDLLAEATRKRDRIPDDPANVAAAAGAAAAAAEMTVKRLNAAVAAITDLRDEALGAAGAAAAVDRAARSIAGAAVPDAVSALATLETAAVGFAVRREALEQRAEAAAGQDAALSVQIKEADERGEGQDALAKAAAVVGTLAADAEGHRADRDRIAVREDALATESEAITAVEDDLSERAKQAEPLTKAAGVAARASKRLKVESDIARARVAAATAAAQQVARAARAGRVAADELDSARGVVAPLAGALATAEADLTAAEERAGALQLLDRAAGVAAEAHPGEDCPVCRRRLPEDFEPSASTSTAEVRAANDLALKAKVQRKDVADRLALARAAVAENEKSVARHAEEHREAQGAADQALAEAVQVLAGLTVFVDEAEGTFDAETASATLTTATTALATHTDDSPPDAGELTRPVILALSACESAAADRAERLGADAIGRTATIRADRRALDGRKSTLENAIDDVKSAAAQHTLAVDRTTSGIRALPDRVRALLPDNAIDVSVDGVRAAAAAIAGRSEELQGLRRAREKAHGETAAVLLEERALDQEYRAEVEEPLNALRGRLTGWANTAAEAVVHLDGRYADLVPQVPEASGIAEIRTFAATLADAVATLSRELVDVGAAHEVRAKDAKARLGEYAAALADVDGFDPDADLTGPHALHPLIAACATSGDKAKAERVQEATAQAQIKPAADLDFAIAAGRARLDALEVLRSELVDAKFLRHLTGLNTQALLGVASHLLGQLTDQRFGFAEGFEIISRSSRVTHTPNRLSGGEKFLASLALALALAELHSRSGPRLGALFLDEGFAALDTAALQAALDVLRERAGSDRLVMVISHLHAVAEAVDDVLWVERGPAARRRAG
ncbi:SMC family ATPase [Amycolatopsis sp. OK19-0408]|uniref:Nuclease SbcCD subunit C n=1 Tax=Amycolatopsis iheyensis TaxID=2945988 RepID=A0A9X2NJA6_9PSEU|nr:SMC family ATPase [Amycolatopsis iheyensis]MCR6489794.1 SMC family ATPase [Amycolatopsis iheyensis]